jgi:hypothetical protein
MSTPFNPPLGCQVLDTRTNRRGVFNGLTRCRNFAIVKYPGGRATLVSIENVRRIFKSRR